MIKQIDEARRNAFFYFESVPELARYIEREPRTWGRTEQSKSIRRSYSWDLNCGYDSAWNMARDGWIEGAQRAQEALREFTPSTPSPELKTDFYGHMPHVPRYCAGAPDSMIRHHTKPSFGSGKVLTLYVPVFRSALVKAEYTANFGVGIAQYINQLEAEGTRVEVYALYSQRDVSRWTITYVWKIKSAEQPLDLAVLSFVIGHPAMTRRLGFALLERSPAKPDIFYGLPRNVTIADVPNAPNGSFILDGMNDANECARTPKAALEYIGKQIEQAMQRESI